MKVSDCPTTQVEVRIEASPAEVWHWLLDVDLPARFSTEFQGGGWVEGSAPGLGAQFRGRNSHPVAGSGRRSRPSPASSPAGCSRGP